MTRMGGHQDERSSFDSIEPSVARIDDDLLSGSSSFQPFIDWSARFGQASPNEKHPRYGKSY